MTVAIQNGPITQYIQFLTSEEYLALEELSARSEPEQWEVATGGVQRLNLADYMDEARYSEDLEWLLDVRDRALKAIRKQTGKINDDLKTDAWIIMYPARVFQALRSDKVPEGKVSVRLNALVMAGAEKGTYEGLFTLLEPQNNGNERVIHEYPMNEAGDALLFSPSLYKYQVSSSDSMRLVLSIGALIDEGYSKMTVP